jgi:hypothetical protein
MRSQVEQFLEDISFNTKYRFLDMAKDKSEIEKVAQKSRIKIPCNDIAIFKAIYAYVDRQNLNGCTLKKSEVEKALDTLVGKAVDFDHFRKRVIGYFIDAFIEDDKIIAYGVFFKGNFAEDYKDVKELMEKDTLGISFEAWGTKEMKTANTYNLNEIEFAGGGLLMKESPAFPGAGVLEMAKERVLEFASVMTKPESFIHTEGESKVKEPEKGVNKNLIECANCKEKFDWKALPECKMGYVKCPKCTWQVDQNGKAFDASAELPELARYYLFDTQAILTALNQVECPSCKGTGMYNVDMIDFKGNKTRVTCVCGAILLADLTPVVKMEKKGRSVSKLQQEKPIAQAQIEIEEDSKLLLESIKIEKSNRNV